MRENTIEFTLTELHALAAFIGGLNEAGVPYKLQKDSYAIAITVTDGF